MMATPPDNDYSDPIYKTGIRVTDKIILVYQARSTGVSDTPVETLASQGIDKNLANRAMTSKRVDADWVGHAG